MAPWDRALENAFVRGPLSEASSHLIRVLFQIISAERRRFFQVENLLGDGFVENHFSVSQHQIALPSHIFQLHLAGIIDPINFLEIRKSQTNILFRKKTVRGSLLSE